MLGMRKLYSHVVSADPFAQVAVHPARMRCVWVVRRPSVEFDLPMINAIHGVIF